MSLRCKRLISQTPTVALRSHESEVVVFATILETCKDETLRHCRPEDDSPLPYEAREFRLVLEFKRALIGIMAHTEHPSATSQLMPAANDDALVGRFSHNAFVDVPFFLQSTPVPSLVMILDLDRCVFPIVGSACAFKNPYIDPIEAVQILSAPREDQYVTGAHSANAVMEAGIFYRRKSSLLTR